MKGESYRFRESMKDKQSPQKTEESTHNAADDKTMTQRRSLVTSPRLGLF